MIIEGKNLQLAAGLEISVLLIARCDATNATTYYCLNFIIDYINGVGVLSYLGVLPHLTLTEN